MAYNIYGRPHHICHIPYHAPSPTPAQAPTPGFNQQIIMGGCHSRPMMESERETIERLRGERDEWVNLARDLCKEMKDAVAKGEKKLQEVEKRIRDGRR